MKSFQIPETSKANIEKLRNALKGELTSYYDTDFNLLRWLQGHNNNLEVILPKLKRHLMFRRSKWNLDKIADHPRNHPVHEYWKAGTTGLAIKTPNVIVNIEQTGRNDYWGMLQTFSMNELLFARLHDLETMLRRVMQLEEESGEQTSIIYIMDLTDLKYNKRLLELLNGALMGISSFMSEHYVELIHSFVLVNAPSFIAYIWALARPLLPEKTRSKVRIFGSNWKDEILQVAVPEVLPSFWNNAAIQVFKADLELAKAIDPSNYYKERINKNAQSLLVGAGKTGAINFEAKEGSRIRWSFQADGHFGYTVYYSKLECSEDINLMVPVYPLFSKIPGPVIVPIEDDLLCEENGIYKFWFSNEHAWMHTLNIKYIIELIDE